MPDQTPNPDEAPEKDPFDALYEQWLKKQEQQEKARKAVAPKGKNTLSACAVPRHRVSISFAGEDGRTQQQFKAECDISNILKAHSADELLAKYERGANFWGHDFTQQDEYMEAARKVRSANDWFAGLPSEIRRQFGDNAGQAIEYLSNPKNHAELREKGLLPPLPTESEDKKAHTEPQKADKPSEPSDPTKTAEGTSETA